MDKMDGQIAKMSQHAKNKTEKKKESAFDSSTIVTSLLPMVLKSAHTPVLDLAKMTLT